VVPSVPDVRRPSEPDSRVGNGLGELRALGPLGEQVAVAIATELTRVADPWLALRAVLDLARWVHANPGPGPSARLLRGLVEEETFRVRVLAVIGLSEALGEQIVRRPGLTDILRARDCSPLAASGVRADLLDAVGADPASPEPRSTLLGLVARDALRLAHRRLLIGIAGWDLTTGPALVAVTAALSELAAAVLEAALAVARTEVAAHAGAAAVAGARLAVIAMGKCGGGELNYLSDVDVVFVADPAAASSMTVATQLASRVMSVCGDYTGEGTIWEVDAALRPEGRDGALVRSLDGYQRYWETWARTWEFQALLKARPVAGDAALGDRFAAAAAAATWAASGRPNFVDDVRSMRRRVESAVPRQLTDRQLKTGRGGLRDVEFAVQLLQLVHGRADETLRLGGTIAALRALADGGYVGRSDALELTSAYEFLRRVEHRLQLRRLRRAQVLPTDTDELRRVGRSLGMFNDPVGGLTRAVDAQRRRVRRLHEKLFYRPLLSAVARLPADGVRLAPEAAVARLGALGYDEPDACLRHLAALTTGVSRRAAIQRTLLPVLLGWFADGADPDGGLTAFRRLSEALGDTPWYLRLLRDGESAAENLAHVLAAGRWVPELLAGVPEAAVLLANDTDLRPRTREELIRECRALAGRGTQVADAVTSIRALRRRELIRIAIADLLHRLDVTAVGTALSDLTAAAVEGTLTAALRILTGRHEPAAAGLRFAVLSMGRLGGGEQSYGSDADVLFVYEPGAGVTDGEALAPARALATEVRRLLEVTGPHPALMLDPDLRPEGRSGPLVRSLSSYRAYYQRWSAPWESQALLRASHLAGDADLGRRFLEMVDPFRYPLAGLDVGQVRHIRRLKARVEAERLPRGADPSTEVKLGRGGLGDVEWLVQLLQLRHAGSLPALRTTSTLQALDAAVAAGLVAGSDAAVLRRSWRLAGRIRNAVVLVRGSPRNSLPTDPRELTGVSRVLGHGPGESDRVVQEWLGAARHARTVYERLFLTD
jgi:glutamate-ammonia-ligase adenylyltransferase